MPPKNITLTINGAIVSGTTSAQYRLVTSFCTYPDLNARDRIYRDQGWSTFAPNALAYAAEQLAIERARYNAL